MSLTPALSSDHRWYYHRNVEGTGDLWWGLMRIPAIRDARGTIWSIWEMKRAPGEMQRDGTIFNQPIISRSRISDERDPGDEAGPAWVSLWRSFVLLFIRTERIIRRGCDKLATHNSSRRFSNWDENIRESPAADCQRRTKLCGNSHTATLSRSQVF